LDISCKDDITVIFLLDVSFMALLLLEIAMEAKIIIIVNSVLYIYLHFLDKVTMTPTIYVERNVFDKFLDAFKSIKKCGIFFPIILRILPY
jgi:hypothetical protein